MLDDIKKQLIHFCTHGNVIEDFVASRRKKARKLRAVVHICFYAQCAAALGCILAAVLMHAAGAAAIIIGALLACAVALFALGGDTAEKTILYLLDLVYAVICFIAGASGAGSAFFVCGGIMLAAAAAALCGFFAAYLRQYLMEFSPLSLTKSDYTRLSTAFTENEPLPEPQLMQPPPLPEQPRSELRALADRLSEALNRAAPEQPETAQVAPAAPVEQNAQESPAVQSAPIEQTAQAAPAAEKA